MKFSNTVMIIIFVASNNVMASQKRGGEHINPAGIPARKAEQANRKQFDPRTLKAFTQLAGIVLENTKRKVPSYGQIMEGVLTKKNWFYTENKLSCPYLGTQDIDAVPAICQDEFEVTVYWPYFNPESPDTNIDIEYQAYALVHEMNRYAGMLKNKSDAAIVKVDDAIEKNSSEQDLAQALSDLGFGKFATGSEIRNLKQELAKLDQDLHKDICIQKNKNAVSKILDLKESLISRMKSSSQELAAIIYEKFLQLGDVASAANDQDMNTACNLLSK